MCAKTYTSRIGGTYTVGNEAQSEVLRVSDLDVYYKDRSRILQPRTLDQVLYQLSQGRACVTKLADGSTAVIVGYDRYNTLLYNFDTGEHYYMGINDSTNSMLEGGNVFVSYIEKQATVKEES